MEYEPILPLRTIAFQVLFLMVAIAIEAGILRQRLRLGFQTSVQYAMVTNLAAVVVGWLVFLIVEPLSPPTIKEQIISYVLFDQVLQNGWTTQLGATLLATGLLGFFATFFIKAKGLEFFLRADDSWTDFKQKPRQLSRDERYAQARGTVSEARQSAVDFTDTVLQANAASFSVILLLLLLRAVVEGWAA
ncbi:MAG: filament integrity protein FraC [Cyanobacteria bacterium J06626_6]